MSPPKQPTPASMPLPISTSGAKPSLRMPPAPMQIPLSTSIRNGHLNLDVFSPINQNGSFEFDRVLKSGEVYKRSRKTKVRSPSSNPLRSLIPHKDANILHSNGKSSISSCARISSQSTNPPPNPNFTSNSPFPTSPPSQLSRTRKAGGNTSLASSPLRGISICKRRARRKRDCG